MNMLWILASDLLVSTYIVAPVTVMIGIYFIKPRYPEWWRKNIVDDAPDEDPPFIKNWLLEPPLHLELAALEIRTVHKAPDPRYMHQGFHFSRN